MQALLGETITHKGFLSVTSNESVAYCAQTPWLINRSIQENILGSSLFDATWYAKVVRGCALVEDFKTYPAGDGTVIGSQGITLSGGQKQRIVSCGMSVIKTAILTYRTFRHLPGQFTHGRRLFCLMTSSAVWILLLKRSYSEASLVTRGY
jgi:hypothetical protein